MNKTLRYLLMLTACISAAGIGWMLGKGPHPSDPVSNKRERAPSILGITESQSATISKDYSSVAREPYSFRKDYRIEQLADAMSATVLGADPVALAVIGELDEAEIAEVLEDLLKKQPISDTLIAAALGRWGEFAPFEALQWAETHLDRPGFASARGTILETWANADPQSAIEWLRERYATAPKGSRYQMDSDFHSIFTVWARNDAAAALDAILEWDLNGSMNPWFGFSQLAAMDAHRHRAFELVLAINDEAARQKGLESLLLAWSADEPAAAAAWLDENEITDAGTQWAVSQRFQRADPTANADWLLARATPENHDRSLGTALAYWVRSDPEAASRWVEESGSLTDGVAKALASGWIHHDPARAIHWAMEIGDEIDRRQAIGEVLYQLQHNRRAGKPAEDVDFKSFTAATGLSASELEELSEKAAERLRGRL